MSDNRLVIVYDGDQWHVRQLALSEEDWDRGEMVYYCDEPISNDHATGRDALSSAQKWLREQGDE